MAPLSSLCFSLDAAVNHSLMLGYIRKASGPPLGLKTPNSFQGLSLEC